MKLDITEEMLFALLRSALHGTHADATIFAGTACLFDRV